MEYFKYYPHHQQALRDASSVKLIHYALEENSLREVGAMHRHIFEDADRRLATGEGFLMPDRLNPKRWPHFWKLLLAQGSAKSSTPESKLAPTTDRQPYQIKLAIKENRRVSLSERLTIKSCRQKKTPRRTKPSFSDTFAVGPPVNGNKGFPSGWTTRISRWTTATEQPKINVGPQRAQTRQKEKLTWGTTGGPIPSEAYHEGMSDSVTRSVLHPSQNITFPRSRISLLRHLGQHHLKSWEFLISYQ